MTRLWVSCLRVSCLRLSGLRLSGLRGRMTCRGTVLILLGCQASRLSRDAGNCLRGLNALRNSLANDTAA